MIIRQTTKFCVVIGLILSFSSLSASGEGFVFGVKPGMGIQTSYIGIELGRLVLLGGADFAKINADISDTETKNGQVIYSNKEKYSVQVLMPYGGAKLYLKSQHKEKSDVSPYLLGAIFKSMPTADLGDNDSEKQIEDILSAWGLIFGGGAEYHFSPSFSVGGEVGIRRFFTSQEDEDSYGYYDSSSHQYVQEISKYQLDLGFGVTYTVITLNYRF